MNHQQQVHRSYASNGGVGRRGRNESSRSDVQSWRAPAAAARPSSSLTHHTASSSPSPSPTSTGRPCVEEEDVGHGVPGGRAGAARDRLLYLTMCLVGQYVDVQVKNGHVYTGIFHTANAEKDFGVVLKMARLTKDGSVKGGKSDVVKEAARKPPLKTLIIHARDFVQIIAKDAHLTGDILPNGRGKENKHELATDSVISQGRRDTERELKPWRPDHDAPKNLGLESTFHSSWNRNWDQFETNKTLFGVETTFDEELYTTKLERGPQSRELEKEASRIAREIEGETTKNIHLAEERGTAHPQYDNMDEESKYSSVLHHGQDDVGEDNADGDEKGADHCNDETFGSGTGSVTESNENTPTPSEAGGHVVPGQPSSPRTESHPLPVVESALQVQALNLNLSLLKEERGSRGSKDSGKKVKHRDDQTKDLKAFSESMNERAVKDYDGRLPKASSVAGKLHLPDDARAAEKGTSSFGPSLPIAAPPASALPIPVGLSGSAGSAFSRNLGSTPASDVAVVDAGRSPSTGSTAASQKKSQLNPNAKEFKLNPNAKVFTPSFTQRAASPISPQQSPVYMHQVNPVVPVGLGQYVQPPAQPAQITQFNTSLASTVTAAPYIQPSAAFVPAVPPQTATIKIPQSQPQVAYAQQQTFRYLPPMQPAPYPHPNGQLYPQQVIYGQSPVVYVTQQFPQGMMQGQPVALPQQGGPMPPPSPPTQTPR